MSYCVVNDNDCGKQRYNANRILVFPHHIYIWWLINTLFVFSDSDPLAFKHNLVKKDLEEQPEENIYTEII